MGYDKAAFVTAASRSEIRSVPDLPEGVPPVWVRSMLLALRARLMRAVGDKGEGQFLSADELAPFQVEIVLECACDEDGERIFDGGDDDRQLVLKMLPDVIDAIAMAGLAVSGITADGAEDVAGNSETPSAVSAFA